MNGPLTRAERLLRRLPMPVSTYYRAAEYLQRRSWDSDLQRYDWAGSPFEIQWAATDDIVRFGGGVRAIRWTASAPKAGLEHPFGAVRDGDWDQGPPSYPPGYPLTELISAERFDLTMHYQAMHDHFVDGVAWEATPFIREVNRRSRSGDFPWNAYRSPEAIARTCERLDELYTAISKDGIRSQRQIQTELGNRRPFLEIVKNEILVDLGRDGSPLFVDGRHRLAIAKLLRLTFVPVVVVVRHATWMERLTMRSGLPSGPA